MILQEVLVSKFTMRAGVSNQENQNKAISRLIFYIMLKIARAYKRSKKGQIALLGELPDFTIDDKWSNKAMAQLKSHNTFLKSNF